MNLDNTYVLNPDYAFKNDGDRVCLFAKKELRYGGEKDWRGFLHPYHAKLLAFFTSDNSFGQKLVELASHFKTTTESLKELLSPYIENEASFFTEWGGAQVYFPSNILIPIDSIADFSPELYRFEAEDLEVNGDVDLKTRRMKRGPHGILWMWTNRCGTRCLYCYADTFTKCEELSTERMLELFEEAKTLKVEFTDIIGGEIMLRRDWDILLKWLVDHDMMPGFISTKVPVSESIAQKLSNTGFSNLFQVSLDSIDDDVLRKMVGGSTGYADRMKKGLELLKQIPVRVQVNTVLTRWNADKEHMRELFEFLNARGDLKVWELRVPELSIYTSVSFKENMASLRQIMDLKEYVEKELIPCSKIPILFNVDALQHRFRCVAPDDYSFPGGRCGYMSERMFVLPDGKVSVCEQMYWHPEFIIGDLKHQSISEVWNSEKARALYDGSAPTFRKDSKCVKCQSFEQCAKAGRRCVVKVLKAYGKENWDYPDPRCVFAPEFDNGFEYR